MRKRKNRKWSYIWGLTVIVLVGVASWSLYFLLSTGASDILSNMGIENFYYQSLITIGIIFILLFFAGWKFKKIFERIIGR